MTILQIVTTLAMGAYVALEIPRLSASMPCLASRFSTRLIISIAKTALRSRTPDVLEARPNEQAIARRWLFGEFGETYLPARGSIDAYAAKQRIDSDEANPAVGHASINDVVACIEHAVKVAGVDHVGIGADFDGIPSVPRGLEDISKMPALRKALQSRGYSEPGIHKTMGTNFLRVIREVVGE